jgi:hypothetical protein
LSDFLSYVIRQQHSETRQSGWLFGFYAQGGLIAGGIRNSPATMSGTSVSGQIGVGIRRQINATHSLTASVGFSSSIYGIRNGLYNSILGENNPLAIYLAGNEVSLYGSSENFSRSGMEFALGYRFNFDRNRRFGDIGSYVELGVFSSLFPVNSRYSTRIMVAMPNGNSQSLEINYDDRSIMSPETGIQATVGWGSFAIYGRYLITNPLREVGSNAAVLPPFTFGLRIGF